VSLKSCSVAALARDISSVGSLTIGASPSSSSSPPACAAWEARRCALSNSVAAATLDSSVPSLRLEGIFKVGPDSEVPDDGIAARHSTSYTCSTAVNAELLALDV
jgi:hypothetical protein